MSKITNLKEVYVEQLKDLYSAEKQLVKALPKLAKAATNPNLKQGFEEHLEQTNEHVARLETIFEGLDEKPTGKKCLAMEGLVAEGAEAIGADAEPEAKDAMLIAAAQRVEHYEMAGYGTVKAYAELLGESEAAELLSETLEEESETNEKLTELSESVNEEANQNVEEDSEAVTK